MRWLYSGLFYLALPFILFRLWWRSRRVPAYRARWVERLGMYPVRFDRCIWVHAVSMGEVIAAVPLVKELLAHYPALPLVMTTMTPTGAAQVQAAFGDRVKHLYVPYDVPHAVTRLLEAIHPVISIIMETELWPNMFAACYQRSIPICLMNARLSERSARGYQRIASLTQLMLQEITVIAAHGQEDAARFVALGAPKEHVHVTGSIKFDVQIPATLPEKIADLRVMLGQDRFIWIAASTHEGEETLLLAAHQQLRKTHPQALLILVPRHPERFDNMASLCAASFSTARRSQAEPVSAETAVYLGDTMGELLLLYGASDVAFVGGSLISRGGHNLLEPAVLSKPLLSGPHLFNFKEISELLFAADALVCVADQAALVAQLAQWAQHPEERQAAGERAFRVVEANRGALAKQLTIVRQALSNVGVQ